MRRRYRFPVSQQANLLGLEWQKVRAYAYARAARFEEGLHRAKFFGEGEDYHWCPPGRPEPANEARFLSHYLHDPTQPEGTILDLYLRDADFPSQLEEVLALRLAEAEVALVEYLGMHADGCRFYARDLSSGNETLYCPHDYLDGWRAPDRPAGDACLLQVHRLALRSVGAPTPEAVILGMPTFFSGAELRARGLTCARLCPNGLSPLKLERKLWAHAHWTDFCVDMAVPAEPYLQAVARWEEYAGKGMEATRAFPGLLHALELDGSLLDAMVADLRASAIAVPELEWVLETLWNDQPRIPLWGRTPRQLGQHLCTQALLDKVLGALRGAGTTVLPRHVLLALPLEAQKA